MTVVLRRLTFTMLETAGKAAEMTKTMGHAKEAKERDGVARAAADRAGAPLKNREVGFGDGQTE